MYDLIAKVFTSPAGSFGTAFAAVASFIYVAFRLHGHFVRMKAEHGHVRATCGDLRVRMDALSEAVHAMRGDVQYVKNTVDSMLNAKQRGDASPLVQAHSPLSLTDSGKSAAAAMGAESAIAANWAAIRSKMDAEVASSNPYDVQTYCLERIPVAPGEFFPDQDLSAMKFYAFDNGRTLFDCMKVVGVLVRDAYLREKGIPLSALDAQNAGR